MTLPTILELSIRWAARIGAILIAATLAAFLFGEPAGPLPYSVRDWAGMILLFGGVLAMLAAWRWELTGALVSIFALGAFAVVVHVRGFAVLAIASIPNFLFLLDWKFRQSNSSGKSQLQP